MSTDPNRPITFSCPYCEGRNIETTATAPYVRGFVLAYQVGSKSYIGCAKCVRLKVLGEAGLSTLIGWFSITALIINPFLIIYNVVRVPFIRPNFEKARKKLADVGIPEDQEALDLTHLGYCLAGSMIAADGKVDDQEIAVAMALGQKLYPDFNEQDFVAVISKAKELPSPQDIATLLREVLTPEGKKAICSYLYMISMADGTMDEAEKKLLARVAHNMDFDLESLQAAA